HPQDSGQFCALWPDFRVAPMGRRNLVQLRRFVDFICQINFGCVGAFCHQQAIYWPELSSLGILVWDITTVVFTTPKRTKCRKKIPTTPMRIANRRRSFATLQLSALN